MNFVRYRVSAHEAEAKTTNHITSTITIKFLQHIKGGVASPLDELPSTACEAEAANKVGAVNFTT